MVTETEIIQIITQMPESLQQELFHYANYLINNYSAPIAQSETSPEEAPIKKRRSGILQGTFVLPLAEDFDESAELYAEVYAEDLELQGLTASAIDGWNSL